MHRTEEKLRNRLKDLEENNHLRTLEPSDSGCVDFSSNDYLGLAMEQLVSSSEIAEYTNSGSGASRLLRGTSERMLEIENDLAKFYGTEAALVFSSGYQANLALYGTLPGRHDHVLYDERVHASIRDGIRLSQAKSSNFRHNSRQHLEEKLARISEKISGSIFVAVESLYSMDGDFVPLADFATLVERYQAILLVDEAHSTGIYGKRGEGLIFNSESANRVFARTHTFGKALGVHGACIVGSSVLIQSLVNFARPFIYSTAPAPSFFEEVMSAHVRVQDANVQRKHLMELSDYFDELARKYDVKVIEGGSPIKSVIITGNAPCRGGAAVLRDAGFDIRAILSPTVPQGAERLRICVHSFNTYKQIDEVIRLLSTYLREL